MLIKFLAAFSLLFGTIEQLNKNNKQKSNLLLYISLIAHYAIYYILYIMPLHLLVNRNVWSNQFLIAYLLLLIATRISWVVFDNKCIFTIWTNKMTGKKKEAGFRDPFSIILGRYPKAKGNKNKSRRDLMYIRWIYINIYITLFVLFTRKGKSIRKS